MSKEYKYPMGTWQGAIRGQYAIDIVVDGVEVNNFVITIPPLIERIDNYSMLDYRKSMVEVPADPTQVDVDFWKVENWGDELTDQKARIWLQVEPVNNLGVGSLVQFGGTIGLTLTGTFRVNYSQTFRSGADEYTIIEVMRPALDYTPSGTTPLDWTTTSGTVTNYIEGEKNSEPGMRMHLWFTYPPFMLLNNTAYVKDYLVIMFNQTDVAANSLHTYPNSLSLWNYPTNFTFTGQNSIPNELVTYYGAEPSRSVNDVPGTRTLRMSDGEIVEVYYTIMRYENINGDWTMRWLQYDEANQRPYMGRMVGV